MYYFGCATSFVAQFKGRSGPGWFILGALFPAIALLVLAALPNEKTTGEPTPDTHLKCVTGRPCKAGFLHPLTQIDADIEILAFF